MNFLEVLSIKDLLKKSLIYTILLSVIGSTIILLVGYLVDFEPFYWIDIGSFLASTLIGIKIYKNNLCFFGNIEKYNFKKPMALFLIASLPIISFLGSLGDGVYVYFANFVIDDLGLSQLSYPIQVYIFQLLTGFTLCNFLIIFLTSILCKSIVANKMVGNSNQREILCNKNEKEFLEMYMLYDKEQLELLKRYMLCLNHYSKTTSSKQPETTTK